MIMCIMWHLSFVSNRFDNMFRIELFRNSFPVTNEKENIGETSEVEWRTDLNDTQQKIIKLLSEDHQLSAVKLAEKIGVVSRNIENNIILRS